MHTFLFEEAGELVSGKGSPEEVAANFTCAVFETAQDVLRGARHTVFNRSHNLGHSL